MKNIRIFVWKFSVFFLVVKISIYFSRRVFVMWRYPKQSISTDTQPIWVEWPVMSSKPAHDKTYNKTCDQRRQISLRIRTVWSESSLVACVFCSLWAIKRKINMNPCIVELRFEGVGSALVQPDLIPPIKTVVLQTVPGQYFCCGSLCFVRSIFVKKWCCMMSVSYDGYFSMILAFTGYSYIYISGNGKKSSV